MTDISALAGMSLLDLRLDGTGVDDLSVLEGMPLQYLDISHSQVSDLSPLAGAPLEELHMNRVPVTDLSPLDGMPLKMLGCLDTPVTDVSPLARCRSMERLVLPETVKDFTGLGLLSGLRLVNNEPVAKFLDDRHQVRDDDRIYMDTGESDAHAQNRRSLIERLSQP